MTAWCCSETHKEKMLYMFECRQLCSMIKISRPYATCSTLIQKDTQPRVWTYCRYVRTGTILHVLLMARYLMVNEWAIQLMLYLSHCTLHHTHRGCVSPQMCSPQLVVQQLSLQH